MMLGNSFMEEIRLSYPILFRKEDEREFWNLKRPAMNAEIESRIKENKIL
jgi:hypothetical protein